MASHAAMRLLFKAVLLALLGGCSSDPPPAPPATTGAACTTPAQCYPGLDGGVLRGDIQCLSRVTNGYCTHSCQADSDCCAVPGECAAGLRQVCAPFESTGQKMCFLSCEAADVPSGTDATAYCQAKASPALGCRSTGGGSQNRKVCVP